MRNSEYGMKKMAKRETDRAATDNGRLANPV